MTSAPQAQVTRAANTLRPPIKQSLTSTRTEGATTVQAVWNGQVIAESEDTVVVEANHYFPRSSVRDDVLRESSHQSRCP